MSDLDLQERLRQIVLSGNGMALDDLGTGADLLYALRAAAATPAAPLVAEALCDEPQRESWQEQVGSFVQGLPEQRSQLALVGTCDALLAAQAVLDAAGQLLHDTLVPDADRIMATPTVAATGLETALRLVLLGAAHRYRVLEALTSVPADAPDEYTDRLPRLIGIALDRWDNAEDGAALEALLRRLDTSGVEDAGMELARLELRRATLLTDVAEVRSGLKAAAEAFSAVTQASEARDDAAAYSAVCRAIVAFHDEDQSALQESAAAAVSAARHVAMGYQGMHARSWSAPRRSTEFAWYGLAAQLEHAAAELADEEFVDTWSAVDTLMGVYALDHTVAPAGSGLDRLIAPQVENAVAQRAGMLRQLQRVVAIDNGRDTPQLPPEAALLLAAAQSKAARESSAEPDTEEPAGGGYLSQLLTPKGVLELREKHPQSTEALEDLAARLAMTHVVGTSFDHAIGGPLRERLFAELEENPAFEGLARVEFGQLVAVTVSFILYVADSKRPWTRPTRELDSAPLEAALQTDLFHFLCLVPAFAGRVVWEPRNVATGRGDLAVQFDAGRRYLVETKRESSNSSAEHLNTSYTPQTVEYQATNVPLSELVVLDLTDHSSGTRHLSESAWVHHRTAEGQEVLRSVVVGVVTGNREPPSSLR
jgi:hypothetical protein